MNYYSLLKDKYSNNIRQ